MTKRKCECCKSSLFNRGKHAKYCKVCAICLNLVKNKYAQQFKKTFERLKNKKYREDFLNPKCEICGVLLFGNTERSKYIINRSKKYCKRCKPLVNSIMTKKSIELNELKEKMRS